MARYRPRWDSYYPKLSVAERKMNNKKRLRELAAEGVDPQPVILPPHQLILANSFWGRGWIRHLDIFSDYSNRLPRGRSYVRTGSVLDLRIEEGQVQALVNGTRLYKVLIEITPLPADRQKSIRQACTGQVKSLLALLQGKLSDEVMSVVMDPEEGLLPQKSEVDLHCNCPDWAVMCKHVAAVLNGIGVRLDTEPELLFTLRGMDAKELGFGELEFGEDPGLDEDGSLLDDEDLEGIFGIELAGLPEDAEDEASEQVDVPEGESVPGEFDFSGAAIAALRRDFGYSREEFADILGVSVGSVFRWERCDGEVGMRDRIRKRLGWIWEIRCGLLVSSE